MFNSKTKYFVIAVGFSSILLAVCPRIDEAPKSRVAEAPKNEERPDWVYEEPDEDDGKLFFVGFAKAYCKIFKYLFVNVVVLSHFDEYHKVPKKRRSFQL